MHLIKFTSMKDLSADKPKSRGRSAKLDRINYLNKICLNCTTAECEHPGSCKTYKQAKKEWEEHKRDNKVTD